ncbi:MAG: polyhydroxyalkanoic acid system family protein [Myxococcota bacterium]
MADIEMSRDHDLGAQGATDRLKGIEDKLRDKYGVTLAWAGNVADVKGKGVSGKITVEETLVSLSLKLGMMLKPLKGKIREGIERSVEKALA